MEQNHEQEVQNILDAAENLKDKEVGTKEYNDAYEQLHNCLFYCSLLDNEAEKQILTAIFESVNIEIDHNLLHYLVTICQKNSLTVDYVEKILEKTDKNFKFTENSLPWFLNASAEKSLEGENLKNVYNRCPKKLFEDNYKKIIISELNNEISQKFFQNLCEFHEHEMEKEREPLRKELSKRKEQNKKLGILGIIGIIIGGLSGLVAIGLGTAIGVGALTFTIVAPIVSAVVSLVLLILGICFTSKFVSDEKEIKFAEEQLKQSKTKEQDKAQEVEKNSDELVGPLIENGDKDEIFK